MKNLNELVELLGQLQAASAASPIVSPMSEKTTALVDEALLKMAEVTNVGLDILIQTRSNVSTQISMAGFVTGYVTGKDDSSHLDTISVGRLFERVEYLIGQSIDVPAGSVFH